MRAELLAQARRTIVTQQLFGPRARLVVAVSGGADSVALLHALCQLRAEWQLTLHVAHLDHGVREASRDDAECVRDLASRWEVPASIERRDVPAACRREGWSLEDGARRIRYEFLLEVARRQSASAIALAHTADDQAETVLMRLVRGTGLMGLGAIPFTRQLEEMRIVRPLLEVWRREVVAYLTQVGVAHREDATNADPRFVRNRVRHELLPLLEQHYNPNIKRTLTQLAEQSRLDYAYLQAAAERQWKRVVKAAPSTHVAITVASFIKQPKALQRQLIRQAIHRVRGDLTQFEFRHWLEIEQLFYEQPVGSIVDLPAGVQLRREQDRVMCHRDASTQVSVPLEPVLA